MNPLIAIVGPTASGKSAVALELARRLDAEIISVDSMQVYRGMDVGTAKPSTAERAEIPHHMVDIADPADEISVAEFQLIGRSVIEGSSKRQIICGGSGLHFRSLVDPMTFAPTDPELRRELEETEADKLVAELTALDPVAGSQVDLANKRRVVRALEVARLGGGTPNERYHTEEAERLRRYEADLPFIGIGVDPGERIGARVEARLESMKNRGLEEEVRRLAAHMGRTALSAIGYREILEVLEGRSEIGEAFTEIEANTLKLARRQRTWFQRDPRIEWIPWSEDPVTMGDHIEGLMKQWD